MRKLSIALCCALAAGIIVGCESENDEKSEKHEQKQAALAAEAKISKEDAEKTALIRLPNGTIKEAELEHENGKLQWSFDVAVPDSKDIMEVNVDAITGEVISVGKD